MKIACTQENLSQGLSLVSNVAGKHPHLPILNNILLQVDKEGLLLIATNLEIGIKTRVRGKVEDTGSFTVQAKLFSDFIHSLSDGNLLLQQKENLLLVEDDNQQTKLKGETAQDFPLIPEVVGQNPSMVNGRALIKALETVVFAASTDESRPELHAVLFVLHEKRLTLVATDSYRLAEASLALEKETEGTYSLIVPIRTAQQVLRAFQGLSEEETVEIRTNDNQVQFSAGQTEIVSRLVAGQYPDYKQIIPVNFSTTITIKNSDLVRGLRSTSLFCQPGINDVKFLFVPETSEIQLRAQNATAGDNLTRLPAETVGSAGEIVFNYRYLLEGALHLDSQDATIEVNDASGPAVLRGKEQKDFLYLVMPIKQ